METTKEYLAQNVTPVMEPLMFDLLMHKPEDPLDFMINWLKENHGKPKGMDLCGIIIEKERRNRKDNRRRRNTKEIRM